MSEYIEMEVPSSSSPSLQKTYMYSMDKPALNEKVIKKEYELRTITNRSISHYWVILPVLCYLGVVVGGLMTSISVGNTFAAFDSYCLFNANFTLIVDSSIGGNITLEKFIINGWGAKTDCLFAEYASAALSIFSGIWIVMVLQCGRGGASRRGLPDAWRIVPPTCIGNSVVFIISCFILATVTTGFTSFCENATFLPTFPGEKNLSCSDILGFRYFQIDKFHTDLVQEYRVAEIGATMQFLGCFLGFIIVTLRCCTGPDFDLYVRREIAYVPANTEEPDQCQEDEEPCCSKTCTATVICHHNPRLEADMDDSEDNLGSFTSHTGLIN